MRITGYEVRNSGKEVVLFAGDGQIRIQGMRDNIIRCVYRKGQPCEDGASALEIAREPEACLKVSDARENYIDICSENLQVSADRNSGRLCWNNSAGIFTRLSMELAEEPLYEFSTGGEEPVVRRVKTVDGERNFVENLKAREIGKAFRGKIHFCWDEEEGIFGLGQGEDGIYNYRGHVQYLYQHNMRIPVPFLVSDKGYGVLVDAGCLMTFNDDERGSYLFLDTVDQLDFYFISGDMDTLIRGFRYLTGSAVMLPKWAFGYVQSKERYESQEELVSIAKEYRRRGVGLDCVVQDWKTWKDDDWGDKHLDKERYPDISVAQKELKKMHVHSMVSVWPNMNYDTPNCREMRETGHLLNDLATYDAFDEEARAIYWKQADEELFSGGFDSWWCDSTEPFSGPDWGGEIKREPWERFQLVGNEHKKYLGARKANLYALAHAKGIYENQRKTDPSRRVLNLTRSGYPGIQKYGTMLWSGDIAASWATLRKQLTEGLNMAMSGMPYWTLDIGAFFTVHEKWENRGCGCNTDPAPKWFWTGDFEEGVKDPGYRELYVRWLQMGAFLPMFRSHGTDTPREIWNFGEPGEPFYEAIKNTIDLRYRFMPYIYSLAAGVHFDNDTMMRSLLFDFEEDKQAAECHTEYMFGRAILVSPVMEPMYYLPGGKAVSPEEEKMHVTYLPKTCGWRDFFTGAHYEARPEKPSGILAAEKADLFHLPLYVRDGSIIPMEEHITYADERPDTPFEIHIYPGADGRFMYYEDAGDGYAYEQGEYNRIPMLWNDKKKSFTIGRAAVQLPDGLKGRECVLILENGEADSKTVKFTYTGEEKEIRCQ